MTDDAVVVEPVVTAEKLRALLAVGCELSPLDFKRRIDLDDHRELVELAKDVAAMRASGGYLVIGADDHGNPTDDMDSSLSAKFDEANFRQKLERFLHPTEVISAEHEIEGHHVVLIYVPRHRLGFTVVKAIGQYSKPGNGQKIVLRPGDVFVRRGTSSERWDETVVEALLAPRDATLREEHRSEFAAMVAAIQSGAQGQSIASGPVQSLVWQLDQTTFDAAVIELLRRDDLVPVRLFLIRVLGDASAAARRGDREEFGTVLDRLISLAANALTLRRTDVAAEAIERIAELYGSAPQPDPDGATKPLSEPIFWLENLARVVALGGLAVVLKEWSVVRSLALQSSPESRFTWLRHGLTMAARSNSFPIATNGQQEQGALIPLARRVTHRLPALRPYAPDDDGYDPEPGSPPSPTDAILDALCAFDALASLVVMTAIEPARFDPHDYYPSFGYYYSRRSVPYWARLLNDSTMRNELLPDADDDALGRAMNVVAEVARSVVQGRWGLWTINDDTVDEFIRNWQRLHP